MVLEVRVTWVPTPILLPTNCVTSALRESLSPCASGMYEEHRHSEVVTDVEITFWEREVADRWELLLHLIITPASDLRRGRLAFLTLAWPWHRRAPGTQQALREREFFRLL